MLEEHSPANLVDILRYHSGRQPNSPAFTFLSETGQEAGKITFAELESKARLVASHLLTVGRPQERALLLDAPGIDYIAAFLGCLYAGILAVPLYPPASRRKLERVASVLNDCRATLLLTNSRIAPRLQGLCQMNENPVVISTDKLDSTSRSWNDWDPPAISSSDIAFLQYTSGSTSAPKGVMVSHGNLLHNQRCMQEAYGHNEDTVLISWLPFYHDMGLIGHILAAVYLGSHCILMSPSAFIQRPACWLEAFSRYRGTFGAAPNFAYDLCVSRVTVAQKQGLDLSSWRVAANGAEPVRIDTARKFTETFASCGLPKDAMRPCYGLAEATLWVTTSTRSDVLLVKTFEAQSLEKNNVVEVPGNCENGRVLVSCGRTAMDQEVAIFNPETLLPCPPGRVGEIWISGPSVARGYWARPDLTEAVFLASIDNGGRKKALRTGDLGFLHEGNLFVTGRLKDLIIINGHNHYPQDIELTVERSHGALQPGAGAAFAIEVDGRDRLVVVHEIRRSQVSESDFTSIAESIRRAVWEEHELEIHALELLEPMTIPKTSSGKIQRGLCRKRFLMGELVRFRQGTPKERQRKMTTAIRIPETDSGRSMQFSLFYFSSNEAEFSRDKYRLVLEGAKFADEHGFAAVWIPERHFHPFGGLYPNPSLLGAALAVTTRRIRIRAGSVVLPLHHPIRVAEEWSVVDNLSNGRVDVAFARGWNANDFVLAPASYANALQALFEGADIVHRLWRGDSILAPNGKGVETELRIHPLPYQQELPTWLTCSGTAERFVEAGAKGWNLLTGLLFQSVEELAVKIATYREARRSATLNPGAGHVTLMLHTFLGDNEETVKETVREPFIQYLRSSVDLWRHGSQDLNQLSAREQTEILNFAFERYYRTSGLFGTPDGCRTMVERLRQIGVDEIACLIDFGIAPDVVLHGLSSLELLQERAGRQCLPSIFSLDCERSETAALASNADDHYSRFTGIHSRTNQGPVRSLLSPKDEREAPTDQALLLWIKGIITCALSLTTRRPPEALSPDAHFLSLGMDSLKGIEFMGMVQEQLGLTLPYDLLFEFPTLTRLAETLVSRYRAQLLARILRVCEQDAIMVPPKP